MITAGGTRNRFLLLFYYESFVKRRTVANEACDAGRVLVNDKPAKASVQVKTGDTVEIQFGSRNVKVEVLEVKDTVKKDEVESMFRYI